MKTYVDKMTVWHDGEPQATIECDDGGARVEFSNHYWDSKTWSEVSIQVLQAIQLMELEQRELDQQNVA